MRPILIWATLSFDVSNQEKQLKDA